MKSWSEALAFTYLIQHHPDVAKDVCHKGYFNCLEATWYPPRDISSLVKGFKRLVAVGQAPEAGKLAIKNLRLTEVIQPEGLQRATEILETGDDPATSGPALAHLPDDQRAALRNALAGQPGSEQDRKRALIWRAFNAIRKATGSMLVEAMLEAFVCECIDIPTRWGKAGRDVWGDFWPAAVGQTAPEQRRTNKPDPVSGVRARDGLEWTSPRERRSANIKRIIRILSSSFRRTSKLSQRETDRAIAAFFNSFYPDPRAWTVNRKGEKWPNPEYATSTVGPDGKSWSERKVRSWRLDARGARLKHRRNLPKRA